LLIVSDILGHFSLIISAQPTEDFFVTVAPECVNLVAGISPPATLFNRIYSKVAQFSLITPGSFHMMNTDQEPSFNSVEPPTLANLTGWQFEVCLPLCGIGIWDVCMPVDLTTGAHPACPAIYNTTATTQRELEDICLYDRASYATPIILNRNALDSPMK
jgi:hypothetical protein